MHRYVLITIAMPHTILQKLLMVAGWLFLAGLALLIAVTDSRYLSLNPATYFDRQREVYSAHSIGLFAHIAGGVLDGSKLRCNFRCGNASIVAGCSDNCRLRFSEGLSNGSLA